MSAFGAVAGAALSGQASNRLSGGREKVYIQFPARLDQGEAPLFFVVGPDGDQGLGLDLQNDQNLLIPFMLEAFMSADPGFNRCVGAFI